MINHSDIKLEQSSNAIGLSKVLFLNIGKTKSSLMIVEVYNLFICFQSKLKMWVEKTANVIFAQQHYHRKVAGKSESKIVVW